jgi:hypothetical protein
MKSVFYAKRCNDTTFFDGLATKKMMINISLYFGAVIQKQFGYYHYQYPARTASSHPHVDSEDNFVGDFVNEQQSGLNRTTLIQNNASCAL